MHVGVLFVARTPGQLSRLGIRTVPDVSALRQFRPEVDVFVRCATQTVREVNVPPTAPAVAVAVTQTRRGLTPPPGVIQVMVSPGVIRRRRAATAAA